METKYDCPYCKDTGMARLLHEEDDGFNWAVCLCEAAKKWRYNRQRHADGQISTVTPQWVVWAAQYKDELARQGATVKPIEEFFTKQELETLFQLKGEHVFTGRYQAASAARPV